MFSFFKKNKADDLMAYLKEGQPDTDPGPAYTAVAPKSSDGGGIEVQEALGGLPPELEEAAVLFANGKVGDTAALLNRYLLENPDNRDTLPWYMLFDLYEASGQREPFEDAAVDFAVKFERSPPTWHPRTEAATTSSHVPLMAYSEKYGSMERVKQPKFFQDAAQAPYVRLDITKVQSPDEETAQAILAEIEQLNKMGKPIELIGAPGFTVRLDAARQASRLSEPGWRLLLEVLRLLGKEEDFDNVAVDYAVGFEVSPPAYKPPLPMPVKGEQRNGNRDNQPENTYCLTGDIGPGNDGQIRGLQRFATDRKVVQVDMSRLGRIDFAVVGLLLEMIIELHQQGCKVTFRDGNELVNTLLQIVGVNQFASIAHRPRA
ncbi:MAG: STAS domain-containing protein [Pseudomonadota bacterium]